MIYCGQQTDNEGGYSVEGAGIVNVIDMANTMANRADRVAACKVPPALTEVLKSVHDLDGHFLARKFYLATMTFHDVTNVLNERKHLQMVIRSIPDSVSLILGRTE